MSGTGWLRSEDTAGIVRERCRYAISTLAPEEFSERFLDIALTDLLSESGADRVGIWLAGDLLGARDSGRVAEARPGPIPEQWRRVDFSLAFLQDALNSSFPILCGPGFPVAMPHLGPLVKMQKAVWLPIRSKKRPMGLALVAYGDVQATIHLDRLCACAEEVSAALGVLRDRLRLDATSDEIRCQVRISRDILGNAAVRSIFSQIVRAARLYCAAEFVALGVPSSPQPTPDVFEIACENAESLSALTELARSFVGQSAESKCIIDTGGPELADRLAQMPAQPIGRLEKVVAIPVRIENRTSAVLVAGLRQSEDTSDTRAKLAEYSLLAAFTLERESHAAETARLIDSRRLLMESSRECLLVVDGAGHISQANRAVRELLLMRTSVEAPNRLEDFFAPAGREAITKWRADLVTGGTAKSSTILEAALLAGEVVRLQFRADLGGHDSVDSLSLIQLETARPAKTLVDSGTGFEAIVLALVGAIDAGILILDSVGNIRMVSDRLAQIMGTSSRRLFELGTGDALIDHLVGQFSRPAETAARWRDRSREGDETQRDELDMIWPSAKAIERLTRPLLGADGQRVGWMEVYQDVTSQRLVQSKLVQAEKMAALGQLVSGIAHELNNPLTSIQGYAQLLSTRKSAAERLSDAQRIALEAERAGGIVKNLLLFARETKPERRPIDLNDVVKRTLALRSYELSLENIFVRTDLDSRLPLTLADRAQLQQVILNLIVNAEQAIRQRGGGGRVGITTRRQGDRRIVLEISDDGPGIQPEVAARVFDPFFTTKPEGVGTGLGLSIVYGIVQEHGGEISVESQPDRGSTFKVELPAAMSSATSLATSPASPEALPSASGLSLATVPFGIATSVAPKRERILVIEDEPTVAQLIADVLSGEGYPVDVLMDSRDGLHRLQNSVYALAICDLKMPHLDGRALFRELRRTESPMQNRLLFVTGDTMSPQTLEFLTSSGMPYLAKPFLVEELKQIVRNNIAPAPTEIDVAAPSAWSREVGRRT